MNEKDFKRMLSGVVGMSSGCRGGMLPNTNTPDLSFS